MHDERGSEVSASLNARGTSQREDEIRVPCTPTYFIYYTYEYTTHDEKYPLIPLKIGRPASLFFCRRECVLAEFAR